MPKAKKRGRPPLPKGHVKESYIPIRVKPEDRKLFEKAAKASEHKTLSGWMRQTLRENAEESMRETSIHQILHNVRSGKGVDNLSAIQVEDIRHFDSIDVSAYRSLNTPVWGSRTTAQDIKDLQRISKTLSAGN
jgi:uncharacterized protein (DUF1778 family)